ncbi:MAG: NAD(P)-dependent alcohol dehydrogenase, partial [Sphingomonadales bacterium]|nr:NAD(P)-dependent alcohol dehydrogenase [Sphingomonadales bacterium]
MKVAALKKPGGLDNIALEDRDRPEAGAGEILVKVVHNSLNYHDYAVAMGGIPTSDGRILMSDGAGEVAGVGEGVSGWKEGDPALSLFFPHWPDGEGLNERRLGVPGDHADGFAAEYVAAPASAFTHIPQGYSLAEAATLPCAAITAWRALFVATKIKPGDIVLVQGSGGVSIFALQFAKAAGAQVIATSSSDEKLDRLGELGADHLINYRETEEWGKAALQWT